MCARELAATTAVNLVVYSRLVMRYLILACFLCLPSILWAKIWDNTAKVSDLGDVYVYIIDGATGGCWTNISESINYAEGKLKALGINVVKPQAGFPADRQGTALIVNVSVTRHEQGWCYGGINVGFQTIGYAVGNRNLFGLVEYSMVLMSVAGGTSANVNVINTIQQALDEWNGRF